jgi:MFS family permease
MNVAHQANIDHSPVDTYPHRRYAIYVLFVLLCVGTTSFLDRYIISLLIEPIKADLGIDDTRISFLQGSAFALFYVAFGLPFGALVDRFNRRNILAAAIAVWSLMTFSCGLCHNFWQLFAARAGVGIGEACLAPAAYSLISDYFAPAKRGRAMSIYNMANYFGVGGSLLVGGGVLAFLGGAAGEHITAFTAQAPWRLVFFGVSSPGLLLALFMFTVREESRKQIAYAGTKADFSQFAAHLRSTPKAFLAVYFVSAATAFVGLTFTAWGPTVFIRGFAMRPSDVGLILGPINAFGGVLGCILSGILSDRIAAARWHGGRFLVMLLWWPVGFCGVLLLAISHDEITAIAAVAIISFGSGVGLASVPPTIHDIVPNELRGRATALHFIFSGILGMGIAPTLVAVMMDYLFHDPTAVKTSLILVLLPVICVSFLVCLLAQPAYQRARLYKRLD